MATVDARIDEYGVSHVFADDWRSLAYGQGYVQARDRLFQMDVLRHVGRGDSARMLGPSQLPSDIQVTRDLYSAEELERQYADAPRRLQDVFEGFAEGVNRAMVEMIRERDIPGEFLAIGHLPERWTPTDSVAIIAYMIGYFGTFGGDELENAIRVAKLIDSLGERDAWTAYGDLNRLRVPEDHSTSIASEELFVDGREDRLEYADVPDEQLSLVRAAAGAKPWGVDSDDAPVLTGLRDAKGVMTGFKFGSNALAVSGEHTETGTPLLMGGPQLGYFRPPIAHEIGLHSPDVDTVGVGIPGIPSVIIGRTPTFTWTVTSGYDDMVDTIAVRLDPKDQHRYEWDGEWHRMRVETVTRRSSIIAALTGGERPRRRVRQERAFLDVDGHTMPVVAWNPDERVAWAQRTTIRGDELTTAFDMLIDVPSAESAPEAADAFAEIPYSFNLLVADDESIHFVHTGRVPERDTTYDWRIPVPGQTGLWKGAAHTVSDYGMRVTDPEQGYVAQWNNAPVAGWRAGDEEQVWDIVHRADRLEAVVQKQLGDGPFSYEDVRDTIEEAGRHDPVAMHTVSLFYEAVADTDDAMVAAMAAELERWHDAACSWESDGDGRHAYAGMAIWETTREELLEAMFREPLGELLREANYEPPRDVVPGEDKFVHGGDHGLVSHGDVAIVRVLRDESSHEWLGSDSAAAVHEAMHRAGERLRARFHSADPTEWRIPERTVKFSAMGALPEVDIPLVHRGTFNQVVSPGDGRAESVLAPANSGHVPLSALRSVVGGDVPGNLEDQYKLYKHFEFKPFPVDSSAVGESTDVSESFTVTRPGRFERFRALFSG